MSKKQGKRGFVAPQATDFAHSLAAERKAQSELDNCDHTDDAIDALAGPVIKAQSLVIGTPATTPAELAEKIDVLYRRWVDGRTLSDPSERKAIAALPSGFSSGDAADFAKGLLALYMDASGLPQLPGLPQPSSHKAAWTKAVAAVRAAEKKKVAAEAAANDAGDGELTKAADQARDAWHAAILTLLHTRAPDAAAMAEKARIVIETTYSEWRDEDEVTPAFLSRVLGSDAWDDGLGVAVLLQDALALSDGDQDLIDAKPDRFDADAWIDEMSETHGADFRATPDGRMAIARAPIPPGGPRRRWSEANAAFQALPTWKQQEVVDAVDRRAQKAARLEAITPDPIPAEWQDIWSSVVGMHPKAEAALRRAIEAKVNPALFRGVRLEGDHWTTPAIRFGRYDDAPLWTFTPSGQVSEGITWKDLLSERQALASRTNADPDLSEATAEGRNTLARLERIEAIIDEGPEWDRGAAFAKLRLWTMRKEEGLVLAPSANEALLSQVAAALTIGA